MEEISRETIGRCRDGDVGAFSRLVGLYEGPVYCFVYRLLRNTPVSSEAEDVVQDIFIKVYHKIHTYDLNRGCKFSTWLFTIARNHCVSLLRKKSVETGQVNFGDESVGAVAEHRLPNPRDAACGKELSEKVAESVSALPERMRTAFVLRHYEDMSYDEIAAIMDCSNGTVKSQVAQARRKLLRDLDDYL